MNCVRFSRLFTGAIVLATLSAAPSVADAQAVYAPSPAYVPAPVYRYPRNRVPRPRYFVATPSMRYYADPSRESVRLRRFAGYSVNGLSNNWPTGRNIPMAKPWLPPR